VQRKVFGPKRGSMKWGYPRIRAEEGIRAKEGQVTGDWRRLLNDWLLVLYSAPNIMCAIKSRRRDGRGM